MCARVARREEMVWPWRAWQRAAGYARPPARFGRPGIILLVLWLCLRAPEFFRGLQGINPGDSIELDTLRGTEMYRVERTWIVNPEDVSVLDPTPGQVLTLVTCYPFYFVGSAPQRFIVRAVRVRDQPVSSSSFTEHPPVVWKPPVVLGLLVFSRLVEH